MQKQDWVNRIERVLAEGQVFVYKTMEPNKSAFLFAVDVFRRLNHGVTVNVEPTEHGRACLYVTVTPHKSYFEYTLRRDDDPAQVIQSIAANENARTVSIRGCGTVINSLFQIMDWALHNGWFMEKSFMSTLTQTLTNQTKQRNTTLNIVIRKGSNVGSI